MGGIFSLLDRMDRTLASWKSMNDELKTTNNQEQTYTGQVETAPVIVPALVTTADMRELTRGPGDPQVEAILTALYAARSNLPPSTNERFEALLNHTYSSGILRRGGDMSFQYGRYPNSAINSFYSKARDLIDVLYSELDRLPVPVKLAVTDFVVASRFHTGDGIADINTLRFTAWKDGVPMMVSTSAKGFHAVAAKTGATADVICNQQLSSCGLVFDQSNVVAEAVPLK